jgi:hypothetical protein
MAPAAELFSSLTALSAAELAAANGDDLVALARLVRERNHDHWDERCGRLQVDRRGWASELCGPLYWGQRWTKTQDDHASVKGTPAKAPFPNESYFRVVMGALLKPIIEKSQQSSLFIAKSREMMTSWTVCLYVAWLCQWRPGTTAVVQTLKETKAAELVRYMKILTENQEPWLQDRHPVEYSNAMEIGWKNGSRAFGIPQGEHQIRMFHPTVVVFDEMAFMPDAEACYSAVLPVAKQIIAVSSAAPGWFGDQCAYV